MNPSEAPIPHDPIVAEVEAAVRTLNLAKRSAELDRDPAFPRSEFQQLGRLGLLGLRTPQRLGGRGLALPTVGIALHHLAYRAGTTFAKLSLQPEFAGILGEHGEPALVDQYFRPLVRGEMLVGNQVTEPEAGADAGALALRAERTGPGYRLTGTKSQAAFAVDADAAIVYARTAPRTASSAGISAFVVPQDGPEIHRSTQDDLGERWMRRGTVHYEGVEVTEAQRIGPEGRAFDYLKGELVRERLLLAAIYLGVGRSSFDEVVQYAGGRATFGRPIASHEAVGFPLVEDWARLDAAWLYTYRALERMERGETVEAESALAKWMATEVALTAIDHAIQFSGGKGYSKELAHERRWRDVRSGALAHGPSEIMHLVAARSLWPRRPDPA
ncbi:MAG: acyl-CoA dehydrogenase [Thermoplasmata archaeon]|nr:acyl-CoA dehydrogenase [Thermoplasmata archaeon]MCI4359487.1 acyl-CoA dehydrogenase [Thermoplasmata archaeon]